MPSIGIRESGGLKWLNKEEWVDHYPRQPRAEAEAEFDRRVANPQITNLKLPGDEVRCAVVKPPETDMFRERVYRKEVQGNQQIESQLQADEAMRQLATVGVGAASAHSGMFGGMDHVFRPGVATGSDVGQRLTFQGLQAAPTGHVVPPAQWEGLVPKHKRQLSGQVSEPLDDPPQPAKKPRARAKAQLRGVTGQLLEVREQGLGIATSMKKTFIKFTVNASKKLQKMAEKGQHVLSEESQRACEDYDAMVERATKLESEIGQWTMANGEQKLAELKQLAWELASLKGELDTVCQQLKDNRAAQRSNATRTRVDELKERTKHTAIYKGCGADHLVSYFYKLGLLTGGSTSGQIGRMIEAKHWPTILPEEDDVPADKAAYFPPEKGKGVGQRIRSIFEAINETRVAKSERECLQALSKGGEGRAAKRMEPRGQPEDTLELGQWVPQRWQDAKMMPEALRSFGAPTLLVAKSGEARVGQEDWPFLGVGQFMICVRGAKLMLTWPVQSLLDKGCAVSEQENFLFKDMGFKDFCTWADGHAHYVTMTEGSAVWIPYGWNVASLTRAGLSVGHAALVVQPYITRQLTASCESWFAVASDLVLLQDAMMKEDSKKKSLCEAALQWLQASAKDYETKAGQAMRPAGPAAISDGPAPPGSGASAASGAGQDPAAPPENAFDEDKADSDKLGPAESDDDANKTDIEGTAAASAQTVT